MEKGLNLLSQMYFSHRSEYHYLHTAFLHIGDKKIAKVPLLREALQISHTASQNRAS